MVWSVDGDQATSIAADNASLELAVGKSDGSITLWDTQLWSIKALVRTEPVGHGSIAALKYCTVKISGSSRTLLLVGSLCTRVCWVTVTESNFPSLYNIITESKQLRVVLLTHRVPSAYRLIYQPLLVLSLIPRPYRLYSPE